MRLPWVSAALYSALTWTASAAAPDEDDIKTVTPYLDSDMSSRWFDFGGDTIIRTDSYVRLSSDRPSQSGWLFSRVPLTATNWQVEVEFKVTGKNQLYGDGMAMWVTRQRGQLGDVFGHTDRFEGLGIFIDTYKNNRPGVVFPYVMAMFGDGQTSYDKNTDGKSTELAGCSARGIRNANRPTRMRVTYFQDKQLKLELQYKKENEWQLCFDIDNPPAIPNIAYLGFSAETGELSDNHDIISVKSKNLYMSPASSAGAANKAKNRTKNRKPLAKKGGSWSWFFFKIVIFCLLVAGGYVGYTAYRARTRSHRF
ncbi:lectin, mannose-binding 2 [Geosmithia morbida]|uniref:Lectin, mannose-binding 2 n=1 Tax=Geosmithia morbida TaxID=1094350 RepID=A0A9P4YR48_9HYPO|nr:lectin, mannose-binding 2 [Geosmithia morbida]KAF4121230.1 lectin, mannose-binding 2 [Geosmithia morbida]